MRCFHHFKEGASPVGVLLKRRTYILSHTARKFGFSDLDFIGRFLCMLIGFKATKSTFTASTLQAVLTNHFLAIWLKLEQILATVSYGSVDKETCLSDYDLRFIYSNRQNSQATRGGKLSKLFSRHRLGRLSKCLGNNIPSPRLQYLLILRH